jgi:hypothetical protein
MIKLRFKSVVTLYIVMDLVLANYKAYNLKGSLTLSTSAFLKE